MASILVVDDDAHLREVVRFALARAGHAVELACDGERALERIDATTFDLVVLDILMPELDGLAACRRLRVTHPRLPVILLSSRGEESDRVLGLDLGADDYLAKPFSPRELVARVGAVLRRTSDVVVPVRPVLEIGALVIDRDRHELRTGDEPIAVTATELRLLATLALHRGRVLSRGQLIAAVYGDDHRVSERTVDTHVRNLRAKLAASNSDVIETVHGVGYRCS